MMEYFRQEIEVTKKNGATTKEFFCWHERSSESTNVNDIRMMTDFYLQKLGYEFGKNAEFARLLKVDEIDKDEYKKWKSGVKTRRGY